MRKSLEEFAKAVELKARTRKPVRTGQSMRGTLASKRNYRVAIRESALRGTTCVLLYRKATTSEVKRYEVIPTEYAYRRNRDGQLRKVLWVQDVRDRNDTRQIKCFYMRNIIRAAITDRHLAPKWPVLIS